jgi:hypothetical protein
LTAASIERFVGRSPDSLNYAERSELDGKWAAFEMYTPERLPLRLFVAVGESARECRKQLSTRGLDPSEFEFVPLRKPF